MIWAEMTTDERTEFCRKNLPKYSYGEMAKMLHTSRNNIASRCYGAGLKKPPGATIYLGRPRKKHRPVGFAVIHSKPKSSVAVVDKRPPRSRPVFFKDRRRSECAWPLWSDDPVPVEEKTCCGLPVKENSGYEWCEHHHDMGTRPLPPRHRNRREKPGPHQYGSSR